MCLLQPEEAGDVDQDSDGESEEPQPRKKRKKDKSGKVTGKQKHHDASFFAGLV